jgi:hypothetical protein
MRSLVDMITAGNRASEERREAQLLGAMVVTCSSQTNIWPSSSPGRKRPQRCKLSSSMIVEPRAQRSLTAKWSLLSLSKALRQHGGSRNSSATVVAGGQSLRQHLVLRCSLSGRGAMPPLKQVMSSCGDERERGTPARGRGAQPSTPGHPQIFLRGPIRSWGDGPNLSHLKFTTARRGVQRRQQARSVSGRGWFSSPNGKSLSGKRWRHQGKDRDQFLSGG